MLSAFGSPKPKNPVCTRDTVLSRAEEFSKKKNKKQKQKKKCVGGRGVEQRCDERQELCSVGKKGSIEVEREREAQVCRQFIGMRAGKETNQ